MGYSHYFKQEDALSTQQWNTVTQKFRELYQACLITRPLPIQYELDEAKQPQADENAIRFNGIGDEGHETFLIDNHDFHFAFCKTAGKPYDLAVTATLLLFHHYAPGCYDIHSDGDTEDWEPAQKLLKDTLNLSVTLPESLSDSF